MGSEAGVGEPEPGSVCVLLGLGERTVSGWSGVGVGGDDWKHKERGCEVGWITCLALPSEVD